MATLLLSAAGAAVGAGFGGTVLGLSGAVIGRAVGATIGRAIDQRVLGSGSDPVDVGRIDRLRLTGAGEGGAIGQIWGRMRVGGQVIWATEFTETVRRRRTGKGAPKPKVNEYSYSVSLAIALCEGEILRVGRIWADGNEISARDLNLRIYVGSETQLPDPLVEAVEGTGRAPAYRGLAYVVIEDLELSPYGNRVPQFSFEVVRAAQGPAVDAAETLSGAVRGVALIPGTGEYGLAVTPVHYAEAPGRNRSANVHSPSGKTDFATSLEQLTQELPNAGSVSLVVSWFGDDLRCSSCRIRPKVEQKLRDGVGMPWRAGGITRASAQEVPKVDGASIYGGTPADASVIEAIRAIKTAGKDVMFYPFVLMDQVAGNALTDPWTGAGSQPTLPWRGRITLAHAPGQPGSTDRSAGAEAEVQAFFGMAEADDFSVAGETVSYHGPNDWGFRRFILHNAYLCKVAGGVESFCIGSEMRSLTQIRGAGDSFPTVAELKRLAEDCRSILGPQVRIGYAADWSEYSAYQADGNLYFHLDALWADPAVDFVGIDNYMPISDWRDGEIHADSGFGSIYNPEYLRSNIAGGEGFDWYYDGPEGAEAQRRLPITDGIHGEPWVHRYKDLKSWWSNLHHDRLDGIRSVSPTGWVPGSKPIRFTEYGCAAIDKGSNQPNRFIDAKSSESGLPAWSNGQRDDLIQMQYLLATVSFWSDPQNNPVSSIYGAPMIDMDHAHAWAWDARPFPEFPGQTSVWSDGENYARGHWLNGRASNQPLAAVVRELCQRSGVDAVETGSLFGLVRGFQQSDITTARSALQPLMLAFGFDVFERDGLLMFRNRDARAIASIDASDLAVSPDLDGAIETVRSSDAEMAGQVRLSFVDAQSSYETRSVETRFPDEESLGVSQTDLPLALTRAEGLRTVERWLAEARVARDAARFALPKSRLDLGAGDVVRVAGQRYRVDRVEQSEGQLLEAVRVEAGVYLPSDKADEAISVRPYVPPVPVLAVFLDLPLMTGQEVPHAPHVAVAAEPWPGSVAIWSSSEDAGYELNRLVAAPATIGVTESPLMFHSPGLWDLGAPLRVRLSGGELSSASRLAVLNGANAVAIGDGSGSNWEVFQFAEAQVVAPETYDISIRLRGQLGTDGIVPSVWPVGSTVVLLDLGLAQIDLAQSSRGLARFYRVGMASRGVDDSNVTLLTEAFDGIGLRPYTVAHLRSVMQAGDVHLAWKRRTRLDGDSWQSGEVPLAEESEAYLVRVIQASSIVSEYTVTQPQFIYAAAMRAADGVSGVFQMAVAQISASFGPGPLRLLDVVA
ncbi:glycoside hydrolase TIM-barrel-like domain-containing protein [Tabrizicola sp.]|uniref:baseplate multidomain protein megatron n=1 Tax=Tabrizicola sp. TaxID=2005166 RepID=UPI001A381C7C|nr:glycoside hydrolase TIM-barrel-like domain-containing protein [Tabrizicola sp.]MBL9063637.1 glycoside hydrolase TIM-barrel-like domain-containing protein [Tabrizicola sp.]